MLLRFSPLFSVDGAPAGILPVPAALSAPVIDQGAQAGTTPSVTPAEWSDVPPLPEGMTREVETRFTIAGSPVAVPLDIATVGSSLRAEQRARHVAGSLFSVWSDWVASDPVVITQREVAFPDPLVYTLTLPPFIATTLSIVPTQDGNLLVTGVGEFSASFTSPAGYGGSLATDQSEEGAAAVLSFEGPPTAPLAFFDPVITRTAVAPGGTGFKVGDTFTARPAIWAYDADDDATVQTSLRWFYGTTALPALDGLITIVAPEPGGDLNCVETMTGAGATRTAKSNTIAIAASASGVEFPSALTYTLTLPAFTTSQNVIVAGDAEIIIVDLINLEPDLAAEPGDQSIIITGA